MNPAGAVRRGARPNLPTDSAAAAWADEPMAGEGDEPLPRKQAKPDLHGRAKEVLWREDPNPFDSRSGHKSNLVVGRRARRSRESEVAGSEGLNPHVDRAASGASELACASGNQGLGGLHLSTFRMGDPVASKPAVTRTQEAYGSIRAKAASAGTEGEGVCAPWNASARRRPGPERGQAVRRTPCTGRPEASHA